MKGMTPNEATGSTHTMIQLSQILGFITLALFILSKAVLNNFPPPDKQETAGEMSAVINEVSMIVRLW